MQEPLFNDTVFRYFLQHDLISDLTGTPSLLQEYRSASPRSVGTAIDDQLAVSIVATLGTKGRNFLTCAQSYQDGENVMSTSVLPGRLHAAVHDPPNLKC